ncbi:MULTISPECIES: MBL fold metallo-hydrolase [Cyanophyceae]|uniref:MBL fold metallo-hydrolase n=1 Tax=Cyanophyceae TaxID=3028117 RepID=UPI0016871ECF|nr:MULTISPECIES: MBL fold metallo-hydrolase [Cyanophyceae]MBD1918420.1 MBL fold metallo-hydrolase [Phormidium sp. FACHB-77]MBD2028711.1 MBL fold metallo-hydrolase [Phormidium sp. FACHB-322]MBD2051132.1 MBL fold metallo-hydrolase [Leptolyngbya sp. FACHB-60]
MTAASAPVSSPSPKAPRPVFDTVYAFAPNRDTQGATAYFIVDNTAEGLPANLLIDAPAWDEENRAWLAAQGGVQRLFITHRGGMGRAAAIQKALGCEVVIQEQEAYLLPDTPTTAFHHSFEFSPELEAFWTPGHSPGSACLYYRAYGGVLFTGRHLLPSRTGEPEPLRLSKTFHWPRQLQQVEALKNRFSTDTLAHICPGASTGFLRGQRTIDRAYERLQAIDIETYRGVQSLL